MSKDKNSRRQELCIRDELGFIVAWQVGMSEDEYPGYVKKTSRMETGALFALKNHRNHNRRNQI